MRTIDFCFPLPKLRAPAPRELPASLRDLRLALGRRACTRDQETGEFGVSRRRIRFGRLGLGWRAAYCSGAPDRAVPLTPLSLPNLTTKPSRVLQSFRFAEVASCVDP
jgi:hypothetical protein